MLTWARANRVYIDGHHLAVGVDVEALSANRYMNVIDNHYVNEMLHEKPFIEARDNARAKLRQVYDRGVSALDGVASDDESPQLPFEGQMPEMPPGYEGFTPQSESGFTGLEPPMG